MEPSHHTIVPQNAEFSEMRDRVLRQGLGFGAPLSSTLISAFLNAHRDAGVGRCEGLEFP